jgi:hypothetical protein
MQYLHGKNVQIKNSTELIPDLLLWINWIEKIGIHIETVTI